MSTVENQPKMMASWYCLQILETFKEQSRVFAKLLFENALAIKCIAGDEKRALKLKNSPSGELPWSKVDMCKIISKDDKARGESTLPDEDDWKLLYGQYAWLCEIKHPTLRQAIHDAGATAYGKSYAVMASPDARKDDLGSKQMICFIVLLVTRSAINAFAAAAGIKNESDQEKKFSERMEEISQILSSQIMEKTTRSMPFGFQDTKWGKKNLRPLPCLKS